MTIDPSSGSATSLMFCRIGLGLREGTTPPTIPNAASSPSRLHKAFMRLPRVKPDLTSHPSGRPRPLLWGCIVFYTVRRESNFTVVFFEARPHRCGQPQSASNKPMIPKELPGDNVP